MKNWNNKIPMWVLAAMWIIIGILIGMRRGDIAAAAVCLGFGLAVLSLSLIPDLKKKQ